MPRAAADARPVFVAGVDLRIDISIRITVYRVVHSVATARLSSKLDV